MLDTLKDGESINVIYENEPTDEALEVYKFL